VRSLSGGGGGHFSSSSGGNKIHSISHRRIGRKCILVSAECKSDLDKPHEKASPKMDELEDTNTSDLAIVLNSLNEANKALRRVIERGSNEVGQLEKLEDKFRETNKKFCHFKEFAHKSSKQADMLKSRLNQDIVYHRQSADSLKRQIDHLRRAIEEQTEENSRLSNEYKTNVEKHYELKKNNDLSATIGKTSSPQSFIIRRLQDELEYKY
jgi:septal ring factor EnvC (AmiA/AmiB activator)